MTRCWLIRHAEPVAEASGRCYGSMDFGLSEHGRSAMAMAAEYLKDEQIAAVYSSPLLRARESAEIVVASRSIPVELVSDFRELDFGEFEGLTYDEIAARHPDVYREWMDAPTGVRFPKGECFEELRMRVLSAFQDIVREKAGLTVAIISHGGVNRALLAWALQIPDSCVFRLAQDYAAINLLTVSDGVTGVQLLNYRNRSLILPGRSLPPTPK
jgi:broad specificity phosphatase PhoE